MLILTVSFSPYHSCSAISYWTTCTPAPHCASIQRLIMCSPPAVHALTRLPDILSSTPMPQTLFRLVASVSERKYANIYSRAAEANEAAQRSEVAGDDLKMIISTLLDKFIGLSSEYSLLTSPIFTVSSRQADRFRRKTFSLLSRAYTSIPLQLVQSYLNLSSDQVLTGEQCFILFTRHPDIWCCVMTQLPTSMDGRSIPQPRPSHPYLPLRMWTAPGTQVCAHSYP